MKIELFQTNLLEKWKKHGSPIIVRLLNTRCIEMTKTPENKHVLKENIVQLSDQRKLKNDVTLWQQEKA